MAILLVSGFLGMLGSNGWALDRQTDKSISVAQFVRMLDHKDFILINVHIPYEGEIEGTDILIPFNKIDHFQNKLPENKAAKVVVYCLMGPMGSIAAEKLADMGYARVMNLEGGLMAWQNFGKAVLNRFDRFGLYSDEPLSD